MDPTTANELKTFIDEWEESAEKNREVFIHFKDYLAAKEGVVLDFLPRPGVTYSLRAVHANQKDKELFIMVDVIDDDPRWLSICFYGDMISDPDEMGDFVPEGLLGEDAVCFDVEEKDEALIRYVKLRLDEAWRHADGN
jgi:hypothetical protein